MSAPAPPRAAQEPWWELRLRVPAPLCEDLSALLIDDGALGVQTLDAQAPEMLAPRGHASLGPASLQRQATAAVAESAEAWAATCAPGPLGETTGILVASYTGALAREDVLAEARGTLAQLGQADVVNQALLQRRCDDGWAHAWKPYFKPQKLGRRLWVVPSWESNFVPPTGSVALRLDPGMAFGTGQHATTALCMRAIERWADALPPALRRAATLLDVGCGSGILALTALALGVGHATAIDTDPLATEATVDNLARMAFAARANVSGTAVGDLSGCFALVVANILAPPLMAMAPQLLARLAPGGQLLLSGILAEQAEAVVSAFARASGQSVGLVERLQHEGWVALILAH